MNYYVPTFNDLARAQFQQLSPWLQEAVLDAVEQMLRTAPPPSIARRLTPPVLEHADAEVVVDGRPHYLFLHAAVDPRGQVLVVLRIGLVVKPI